MERIKVLTGSEVESDYQEPESMDTRVVMGQEALLKNMETQIGVLLDKKASALLVEKETMAEEKVTLDTGQEGEVQEKSLPHTPAQERSWDHMLACSNLESKATDTELKNMLSPGDEGNILSVAQCEVPSLSFSEPSYTVDPQRVGVLPGLDPDRYYTAPSTPIKMAYCSHPKQQWQPGNSSPGPNSPTDESDLCSPPTSPSGSYITAEGGSWTSSYTSGTSHSCSPNLIVEADLQEVSACYVASLSEIGDELGEDRHVTEREHCYCKPAMPELVEDEEHHDRKMRRENCRPHWVTEYDMPHESSGRNTDSEDEVEGSEVSVIKAKIEGVADITQALDDPDQDLDLDFDACISEHFSRQDAPLSVEEDFPSDLASSSLFSHQLTTASTPLETECLTPATCSSEVSDTDNNSLYSEMGSSSLFFQGCTMEDGSMVDGMFPASRLPVHASLIFQADSMEITLFPTDEEPDNDVDAYAAGEEEGDVDEYDDEDDVDINDDSDLDGQIEARQKGERGVDEPNEEDTSASFLNSLSENSINEGVDESFAYQDDTEDSIDSTSCNGDDDHLYSTERQAELTQQFPEQGDHVQAMPITHAQPESTGSESEMDISSESSGPNLIVCPYMPMSTAKDEDMSTTIRSAGMTGESVSSSEVKEQSESTDLKDIVETINTVTMESQETVQINTQKQLDEILQTCSKPVLCMLGATAAGMDYESNIQELDQKNKDNSEFMDTSLRLDDTQTNDLNKGVPLLSYPKDDCSPTNIPVCAYPELSDLPDNLIPVGMSPSEHSLDQDNLAENQPCTDDASHGTLNMSDRMLVVSPKKENSQSRLTEQSDSQEVWDPVEPLSLVKCCESETENVLMCQTAGSLHNKGLSVTTNFAAEDNIRADEENNGLCDFQDKMKNNETDALEPNLAPWKSIEDLSEAGGGEDDANNLQNPEINSLLLRRPEEILVASWTDPLKTPSSTVSTQSTLVSLNFLSQDGKDEKDQTHNTEFNIPGEPTSSRCKERGSDIALFQSVQSLESAQDCNKSQILASTSLCKQNDSSRTTGISNVSNNRKVFEAPKQICHINTDATISENTVFKLQGGSFGTFDYRKISRESKLAQKKSQGLKMTAMCSHEGVRTGEKIRDIDNNQSEVTVKNQTDHNDQVAQRRLSQPNTETTFNDLKSKKDKETVKTCPQLKVNDDNNDKDKQGCLLKKNDDDTGVLQKSISHERQKMDSDHDVIPKKVAVIDRSGPVVARKKKKDIHKKEGIPKTPNQTPDTDNQFTQREIPPEYSSKTSAVISSTSSAFTDKNNLVESEQQNSLDYGSFEMLKFHKSTQNSNNTRTRDTFSFGAESAELSKHSSSTVIPEEDLSTPIQESQSLFESSSMSDLYICTQQAKIIRPCQQKSKKCSSVSNVEPDVAESMQDLRVSFPIQDTNRKIDKLSGFRSQICQPGNPEGELYVTFYLYVVCQTCRPYPGG